MSLAPNEIRSVPTGMRRVPSIIAAPSLSRFLDVTGLIQPTRLMVAANS